MARRPPRRTKPRNKRRGRKKVSPIVIGKVEYVDYKDVELLKKFISDRAKIKGRSVNGNNARQQRDVSRAIKVSREMALIPFTNRVTTQRRERRNDERGERSDGPPSRPTTPPPGSSTEAEGATEEAFDEGNLPDDVTFEAAGSGGESVLVPADAPADAPADEGAAAGEVQS
jgi:small subunit ribosomal protein S18